VSEDLVRKGGSRAINLGDKIDRLNMKVNSAKYLAVKIRIFYLNQKIIG
jgi:hypothetical protein